MGNRLDLTGKKFGRWTVLSFSHKDKTGAIHWHCLCECGKNRSVRTQSLMRGESTSCGCYHKEKVTTHNMTGLPTFKSWESMKQRCTNENSPDYHRYGERGIKICDRWINSFDAFLADMGIRPLGTSLERIDSDGNYEPLNCKWATSSEQNRNKRVTKRYLWDGEMRCFSELAEISGLKPAIISNRLNSGWSIEKTMSTPNRKEKFQRI